ncbi:hypothetical protein TruAng_002594 [Truncatella angustata]|nr:hypothetical protein TruAng_002594 [Truncatella angustata]
MEANIVAGSTEELGDSIGHGATSIIRKYVLAFTSEQREKQQGGALSGLGGTQAILPKGDAVSAANNLNGATGALGNDAGGGLNQKYDNLGKRDTLSLAKLDLNLEVKGTLKTRIHGSLKLTLLFHGKTPPTIAIRPWPFDVRLIGEGGRHSTRSRKCNLKSTSCPNIICAFPDHTLNLPVLRDRFLVFCEFKQLEHLANKHTNTAW